MNDTRFNLGEIVILGDWFIDEYWFIARHYSDVSSHTGPVHYRVLSNVGDHVKDVCGGGMVARILYELRDYEVAGLKNKLNILETALTKKIKDVRMGGTSPDRQLEDDLALVKSIRDWPKFWAGKPGESENLSKCCTLQMMRSLTAIANRLGAVPKAIGLTSIDASHFEDPNDQSIRYGNTRKRYHLRGVGRWNGADIEKKLNDTELLKHHVHAQCQVEGKVVVGASFRLCPETCKQGVDLELINLDEGEDGAGTTRCIRAYGVKGSQFELMHRIDWELAPSISEKSGTETSDESLKAKREKLKKTLEGLTPKAVIIDDHKKGVLADKWVLHAIETWQERQEGSRPRWFVRSKDSHIRDATESQRPLWFRKLQKIELLAIGPEICCRSYPINGLLTTQGRLAEHAYTLINDLIEGMTKDKYANRRIRNIVLASDKFEVVALLGDTCIVARPTVELRNIDLGKINWTTAFFTCLAHELLMQKGSEYWMDPDLCLKMIERAIEQAHRHSGVKVPPVLRTGKDDPCRHLLPEVVSGSTVPATKVSMVCSWPDMKENWRQAKTGTGIILKTHSEETRKLEIWRASTDLPGYIALIEEKRAAVRRIWQKIDRFKASKDTGSLSILLEADPATGKSTLARELARKVDCDILEYDISQMVYREELLDVFEAVAASRRNRGGPIFVFVDEINSTLGGSPVYGTFLSPLEGGNYMRRGRRFELQRCIWMFAGTPGRTEDRDDVLQKEKREDFESRMTLIERIDYRSIKASSGRGAAVTNEASLEQVYLGAKLINQAFSDVGRIDRDILEVFARLRPEDTPGRRIRRLASSLENIQYGRADKLNCTSLEWRTVINEIRQAEEKMQAEKRLPWTNLGERTAVEYVEIDLG